jgi:hypothetical protein
MESVMHIACNGGFGFSRVDKTLIASDWYFHIAFGKATPKRLYKSDDGFDNGRRCFRSDVKVLEKERFVSVLIVLHTNEVRVAICIRQWWSGGFLDYLADPRFVKELEIAVYIYDIWLFV